MILGFTGTRKGMTEAQLFAVVDLVREISPLEVHHGDCVGADREFVRACCMSGTAIKIVSHPCSMLAMRAWAPSDEIRDARPPLQRNHDIVNESDWIIAAPAEMTEQLRSGTWATARYARKVGKLRAVVLPDGTLV